MRVCMKERERECVCVFGGGGLGGGGRIRDVVEVQNNVN